MHTDHTNPPDDIQDAAAYWFARVHSGSFTVAERERLLAWCRSSPRHEEEYRALEQIWQATGMLPEQELRELLEAPAGGVAPRSVSRRHWLLGAGAACTAAVVTGVALYAHDIGTGAEWLQYATLQGEQRNVVLPDGSVMQMNVNTELAVRYGTGHREVELRRGEAAFEVQSNPERPFTVQAGHTRVKVTGTVFTVRRDQERVAVAVQSGSVQVSTGRWWDSEEAILTANSMAQTGPEQPLAVETADMGVLTAWRQGKVVFKDQSLAEVVQEMNRYLRQPIHLSDSRLRPLRMAGVFNIQDAEGFLQALQAHLPVAVVRRPDGSVSLTLLR